MNVDESIPFLWSCCSAGPVSTVEPQPSTSIPQDARQLDGESLRPRIQRRTVLRPLVLLLFALRRTPRRRTRHGRPAVWMSSRSRKPPSTSAPCSPVSSTTTSRSRSKASQGLKGKGFQHTTSFRAGTDALRRSSRILSLLEKCECPRAMRQVLELLAEYMELEARGSRKSFRLGSYLRQRRVRPTGR